MSKNTLLSELINYISSNSSGNVLIAAPSSGLALDVTGAGRFTGQLTLGSTITNGTNTYTLPSATGTLALTSDIPSLTGYVTLGTTQTITAIKTFSAGIVADVTTGGSQGFVSTNSSASGSSIFLQNNSSLVGTAIGINNSSTADGIGMSNDTSGRGIYISNATVSGSGKGISIDNYNSGIGIEVGSESTADAIKVIHNAGRAFNIQSSFGGYGIIVNNTTASTSAPFTIQKQGVTKISFTDLGAATFASSVTANGAVNQTTPIISINGNENSAASYPSLLAFSSYNSNYGITSVGYIGYSMFGSGFNFDAIGRDGVDGFNFRTKTSGTITTRMLITNAGNVGIGTTSPSVALEVVSAIRATNSATSGFASANVQLAAYNGSSVAVSGSIFQTSSTFAYQQIAANQTNIYGTAANGIRIATANAPIIFNTGNSDADFSTERMRITSAGNVGIGTTSTTSRLTIGVGAGEMEGLTLKDTSVNATSVFTYSSVTGENRIGGVVSYAFPTFYSGGSERMRITSGGWVLIGQTSVPAAFGNAVGVAISQGGGILAVADSDIAGLFSRRNSNGDVVYFRRDTTTVGSISVTTSSTSYNTSSDYRLKQDLKPFSGLNLVNQINAYDYEWKSDNTRSFGVLAHELADVLPYAVQGVKDGDKMQSVDYSKIVPVMVQAIKELKAELDTLKNK